MSPTAAGALVRVEPGTPELETIVERAAARHGVPVRELTVRLLLHLPRVASADGLAEAAAAETEADRLAREYGEATAAHRAWSTPPPEPVDDVTGLTLEPVADATARVMLERFHYLASFRPGSSHVGGVIKTGSGKRLAALMTLSPLDVPTIAESLPPGVDADRVLVLSRVFAFDWAPRNSISYLLAKLVRDVRTRDDEPRALLTYLNPNVGFTGSSYRAANWSLWAREGDTRYAYLDARYVTDRRLEDEFGSADPDALAARLGARIAFSRMRLRPLDVYAYALDGSLRAALAPESPIALRRPPS